MRLISNAMAVAGLVATTAGVAPAVVQHTVSTTVDGRDEFGIVNGAMTVRHFSYDAPAGVTVDGTTRPLSFTNNVAGVGPVGITGDYWVRKSVGRDGGYAVQRADGFALAVVDNPNGGGPYTFELADAPAANTTDWMFVRGAGATPGRMNFVGKSGYVPTQPVGTVTTFSLTLDGTEEFAFVNGSLRVRHLSRDVPTAVTINGVTTPLTYGTDNVSQAIPLTLPEQFQFTQTGGRSALYPTQTPVGLLLGVPDEIGGTDTYTWTITAAPEPAGLAIVAAAALVAGRRRTNSMCRDRRST